MMVALLPRVFCVGLSIGVRHSGLHGLVLEIVITSGVTLPLLAIPLSVVGHATVCGPVSSSCMWLIHLSIQLGCLVLEL